MSMTTRTRGYNDELTAPPCAVVPAMRGDEPASLHELRTLAVTVCAVCDPQAFHDCRAGMNQDSKWRVRAGIVHRDRVLSETAQQGATGRKP